MILDGKVTAAALEKGTRERINVLKGKGYIPKLAIILTGSGKPSRMYAEFMKKAALSYGIGAKLYEKTENVTEDELGALIQTLNRDPSVTGILMMMPLPGHIHENKMIEMIHPDKDMDGLTTVNAGRLFSGKDGLFGGTPRAVMAILEHYGISVEGKHAVVIGRSNVIGKPVAMMLMRKNATVTICHSQTKNLPEITRQADILVTAVGKAGSITADMVKPGAVVLDVGINRIHGKTVGDVNYEDVLPVAGALTPVPGGVGSVTTLMIIESIVKAGEHAAGIK